MPARLVALDGTADIPLAGLLTIVGRHRGCDALVDSSRVSRRHCCLALASDGVLVRDLGSTNGVRINGQRVAEGVLRHGDLLAIAHLKFRLFLGNPDGVGGPGDSPLMPDPRQATHDRETIREPLPPEARTAGEAGP